jgi:hypothetical protein
MACLRGKLHCTSQGTFAQDSDNIHKSSMQPCSCQPGQHPLGHTHQSHRLCTDQAGGLSKCSPGASWNMTGLAQCDPPARAVKAVLGVILSITPQAFLQGLSEMWQGQRILEPHEWLCWALNPTQGLRDTLPPSSWLPPMHPSF